MAIDSAQLSVSTTPVNLLAPFVNAASVSDQLPVMIRNLSGAGGADVWIGGEFVTSSNGMVLHAQESFPMALLTSDTPYAVTDSGTTSVAVMVGRQ